MTVQATLIEASIKIQCEKNKKTVWYSLWIHHTVDEFELKYAGSFLFLWKVQHKMLSWR